MKYLSILLTLFLFSSNNISAQTITEAELNDIEPKVIEWRRHLHQNPELSNREFETGKYINARLQEMGIETETGVAHTGVVGFIKGGKPGPTVAMLQCCWVQLNY